LSDLKREMMMDKLDERIDLEMRQSAAIRALIERLAHARKEHPVFATRTNEAIGIIGLEWDELYCAAMENEGNARILDEALDVAATAMRLVMGEVEQQVHLKICPCGYVLGKNGRCKKCGRTNGEVMGEVEG
jgi:hypothetical protein